MKALHMRWLAALLALLLLAGAAGAETNVEASEPPEASAPAEADEASGDADAPEGEASPAPGYVLVTAQSQSGWLPLPAEGEYSLPLKQVLPDGTECENIIHLTPDGVYMEDSTCEGHDCVQQGEVTLENKANRILGNMIICLPNQVVLELYTPEELLEMVKASQQEGGE